jgi:hypothetical protein
MGTVRYTCGVPKEHCTGGTIRVSAGMKSAIRAESINCHASPQEAFRCHARYLVEVLGYTRVGNREFAPPDGGPIRVLTKKSRFGGELRKGKSVEGAAGVSTVPKHHAAGLLAGY